MQIILSENNKGFYERPEEGYTYIYAYYYDSTPLYVGQTIQAVGKRYGQHMSDWSGCRYANRVFYFQIPSEYANDAELFVSKELDGICQRALPAYKNIPNNLSKELHNASSRIWAIANNRARYSSWLRELDLSDTKDSVDPTYMRDLIDSLMYEQVIRTHMPLKSGDHINIHQIRAFEQANGTLAIRNNKDHPILFIQVEDIKTLGYLLHISSNYPIYAIVDKEKYNKHQERYNRLFSRHDVGLLTVDKYYNKSTLVFRYGSYKNHRKQDIIWKVKDLRRIMDKQMRYRLIYDNYCDIKIA